jgi:holdfast attachment protein HfaA
LPSLDNSTRLFADITAKIHVFQPFLWLKFGMKVATCFPDQLCYRKGRMKNRNKKLQNHPKTAAPALAIFALAATGCSFALVAPASAQTITYSGELNVPYGHSYRDENTPYNPTTRDANGNRLIVNGRIVQGDGSNLPGTLSGDFFSGQGGGAIGNQLNVVTNGNWNTVIIDSTQINNGNQTVNLNNATGFSSPPVASDQSEPGDLNGEINLDD